MTFLDELVRSVTRGEGIGILIATAFVVVLFALAPRGQRGCVRMPIAFLALYIVTVMLRAGVADDAGVARPLGLAALLFVGMSVARSGVLIGLMLVDRRLRQPLPKIFQDLIQALVFGGVILVVLRAGGVEPSSLLTTSALLTAVIGLSLQDTLGNMFAGLAIQAQRPFDPGDWIQFGGQEDRELIGCVTEMNWRAITVRTLDDVEVTVPNALLAKQPILNFNKPKVEVRRHAYVFAPFDVAPGKAHQILTATIGTVSGVLPKPAPSVVTEEFSERGVKYWVRYYIRDFANRENIEGEVRDRLWYAFQRAGISIPGPIRKVELHEISEVSRERDRHRLTAARERALAHVDFLSALPIDARRHLAELSEMRLYGEGEIIVQENDVGDEFFIIDWGEVAVQVRVPRGLREVARLGAGNFFGEMGAITGERRNATVRAVRETELQVLNKSAFEEILREAPELAEVISQVIAERREKLGEEFDEPSEPSTVEDRRTVLLDRIKKLFSI